MPTPAFISALKSDRCIGPTTFDSIQYGENHFIILQNI